MRRSFCLILCLIALPTSARAGIVFQVSGQFGEDFAPGAPTGLARGSFLAEAEISGIPIGIGEIAPVQSFSVSVFDALGNLSYSYSGGEDDGYLANFGRMTDFLILIDPDDRGGLVLDFITGFYGNGAVVATDVDRFSIFASQYIDANDNSVSIVSGTSVSIPEPSNLIMASIGAGAALSVYASRRREEPVA